MYRREWSQNRTLDDDCFQKLGNNKLEKSKKMRRMDGSEGK